VAKAEKEEVIVEVVAKLELLVDMCVALAVAIVHHSEEVVVHPVEVGGVLAGQRLRVPGTHHGVL